MLYVFHVDTGTMMTFDINLALESVVTLKTKIEKVCDIPASAQVLLVSGGEVLRPDARVCSYSAGTDTNPIYMFSKNIIESCEPPHSSCDFGIDVDLRDQVESCISMAAANPNYSTVAKCSALAQRFYELARDHMHACEKLVHDQHLQQQGWAAVVANMEDVTSDFQQRAEDFVQKFREHLMKKDEYTEFLSKFNEDLETLSSIPILPALRLNAASNPFTAFDDLHADSESYKRHESDDKDSENKLPSLEGVQKENAGDSIVQTDTQGTTGSNDGSSKTSSLRGAGGSTASEGDEDAEAGRPTAGRGRGWGGTREALTLLHWITAKENQESLKDIAKYSKDALEFLDDSVMMKLQGDVAEARDSAGQEGMKRIKGLEERLSGLEQLMVEAKRIELEQKDLAFSFVQNQQKAAHLGDVSVLRMLCESHCQQLQSMLKNQQKLKDVRGRCAKAKEELAVNLYHRLKWIVYVENRMFETDSCLLFYYRSLSRLKRHLAVISQLHKAPKLFCTAVHEIVRRRTFSQAFLAWASDLARHLLTIHNEETSRRRTFNTLFSGHFLNGLFPGTEDNPPPFATSPPPEFDSRLPRLSASDLQTLTTRMPNLTPEIPPYDMSSVTQFFAIRPTKTTIKIAEPRVVDERLSAEAGVDRGVESETDTEEFEKVGQSPMFDRSSGATATPAVTAPPPSPAACDVSTLTEENLGSQRSEVESLREILSSVSNVCSQSICVLKNELGKLKTDSLDNQVTFKKHCDEILLAWEKCNSENAVRERETLQRLTVDHELEMNDIKKTLTQRDDEISTHKLEYTSLENKYTQMAQEMNVKVSDFETVIRTHEESAKEHSKKIEELEIVHQKAMKDLQEKLTHDFKAQIETLRSRFKLVACTSMDRSPSESSLEKIERPDVIEIASHKAILLQTKEDMEIEREEAIKLALEKQEEESKKKMAEEIKKRSAECEKPINLSDAVRRIMDEKERQLDQSREREFHLQKECMKYKEIIQQLSDPETSDFQNINFLQARVDTLETQRTFLEKKLEEKSIIPTTSVKEQQTDIVELKDSFTNPDSKSRQKLCKSIIPVSLPLSIFSSTSCSNGDIILITWDQEYSNFSVLQDSQSLFLLHIDCLTTLDLKIPSKDATKTHYYIGKVESKDFCVAVKVRNRYNIAQGSRFYRVKVRPLKSSEIVDKDQLFRCDISLLKEKESSHSRGMSVSAIASFAPSTSRNRDSAMTKSLYSILAESSQSTKRTDETTNEVIISEDSEEQHRSEQPDSIEINNPDPCPANDDQLVPCSQIDRSSMSQLSRSIQTTIPTPEESVPYEISKDSRVNEDLISEVAEEATP